MSEFVKLIGPDSRIWHANDRYKKRIGMDMKYCNADGSDIVYAAEKKSAQNNATEIVVSHDTGASVDGTVPPVPDAAPRELSENEKIEYMVKIIPTLPRERWNAASVKNNMTSQPGKFLYSGYCDFEVTKDMISKAWTLYNERLAGNPE